MKKTYKGLAVAALLGIGMIFSPGCRKPCKDVICQNNGATREDGKECVCDCLAGYTGELCESQIRTKFLHDWAGSDVCGPETKTYELMITNGDNVEQVNIGNFSDFGASTVVVATVSDSTLTIEEQSSGGKVFEGTGSLANGELSLDYTISQNGLTVTCAGKFTVVP